MTFLRLTSLFAVVALALAATASGALSPRDYRAQANAACAKAKAQSKALGLGKTELNPTAATVTKSTVAALAIGRQSYASLSALRPPASLVSAHNRALGFLSQELALLAKEVAQLRAGVDWVKALSAPGLAAFRLVGRASAAWGDAGVNVCSAGGFSVKVP